MNVKCDNFVSLFDISLVTATMVHVCDSMTVEVIVVSPTQSVSGPDGRFAHSKNNNASPSWPQKYPYFYFYYSVRHKVDD